MKAAGSIGNMASFPSTVCYLWALSLLCSCLWFEFGAAYSAGAPVTSCSSMKPDHGSPSNNPSPFESLPNQVYIYFGSLRDVAAFKIKICSRRESFLTRA
jgi:hypothetical protein